MSSSSHRILVVDTDEIVVALLSHILHRQGYLVDVAHSAQDAVQRLQQKRHDAVVIDWKLFAALDGCRHPRTILIGNPDSPIPEALAVIRKPIEFGSFVEAVAGAVK